VNKSGGPEVLELANSESPSISAGQILVGVEAAGVNYIDSALTATSDGASGEVELRPQRKFADPRLGALGGGSECGDGCRVSERAGVSGFCRTGDCRSAGRWSCSKAPFCVDIPRRTRLSALAKEGLKSWSMRRWKTS